MSKETNLEPVLVYYSIRNGGDGSAYLRYFLNEEDAIDDQENMDEGWGEPCYGSITTFIGSGTYNLAE